MFHLLYGDIIRCRYPHMAVDGLDSYEEVEKSYINFKDSFPLS